MLRLAAIYNLQMKGGDLTGAYLVTRACPNFTTYIKTPQGYEIPSDHVLTASGNLYGFPPAGHNFSVEFDKCVVECGYKNTPWDLKLFYKWIDGRPIFLIAHSDDFRWFGSHQDMQEWDVLLAAFVRHGYSVKDCTDAEFVGIRITRDETGNYYMDQSRMLENIIRESDMTLDKDEHLPYPMSGPALSKLDNASAEEKDLCDQFPYRKYIGMLMYCLVHTGILYMYAINILSRYCNNPGPRHIEHLKHLLRYIKFKIGRASCRERVLMSV